VRSYEDLLPSGGASSALSLFRELYPPAQEDRQLYASREAIVKAGPEVRRLLKEQKVLEQKLSSLRKKLEGLPEKSESARTGKNNIALWEKRLAKIHSELQPFLDREKLFAEGKKVATFDTEFCSFIRSCEKEDRAIFEAGQAAFVSWCRGYDESDCKIVLALSKLPVGEYAMALGLLKLPKSIKNLCDRHLVFFGEDIDVSALKYQDPLKEEQRLQRLETLRKQREEGRVSRRDAASGDPLARVGPTPSDEPSRQEVGDPSRKGPHGAFSGNEPDHPGEGGKAALSTPSKPTTKSVDRAKFFRERQLLQMLDSGKISEKEFDRLLDEYLDGEEAAAKNQRSKLQAARHGKQKR